ncbi:AP2 domain transcription factor AP2-O2 [Plasmodium brasilianum]|uniref:AP2 domain transcription factor AP2-O2 n=1 Tax=Plasmodium brasilianum TaxID=5824 RepID=A0ACB9Y9D2_PLABR|nr:AP2 domain transcription factor AP2-O2 [Plasmodium brasilianum]
MELDEEGCPENTNSRTDQEDEEDEATNIYNNMNYANDSFAINNSNSGGIKIGINKKDYDIYISQLKDKNTKHLIKNKTKQTKKYSTSKDNDIQSIYYEMKILDVKTQDYEQYENGNHKDISNNKENDFDNYSNLCKLKNNLHLNEHILLEQNVDDHSSSMGNTNTVCLADKQSKFTSQRGVHQDLCDDMQHDMHYNFDHYLEDKEIDSFDRTAYDENYDQANFYKIGESTNFEENNFIDVNSNNVNTNENEELTYFNPVDANSDATAVDRGNSKMHISSNNDKDTNSRTINMLYNDKECDIQNNMRNLSYVSASLTNRNLFFNLRKKDCEMNTLNDNDHVNVNFDNMEHLNKSQFLPDTYSLLNNTQLANRVSTFCNNIQKEETRGEYCANNEGSTNATYEIREDNYDERYTSSSVIHEEEKKDEYKHVDVEKIEHQTASNIFRKHNVPLNETSHKNKDYENGEMIIKLSECSRNNTSEKISKKRKRRIDKLRLSEEQNKKVLCRDKEEDVDIKDHSPFDGPCEGIASTQNHKEINQNDNDLVSSSMGSSTMPSSTMDSVTNQQGSIFQNSINAEEENISYTSDSKDEQMGNKYEHTILYKEEKVGFAYVSDVDSKKGSRRNMKKNKMSPNKNGEHNNEENDEENYDKNENVKYINEEDVQVNTSSSAVREEITNELFNRNEDNKDMDIKGNGSKGSANEKYNKRPLRKAAKKCITLWSEELKKKSEKSHTFVDRAKGVGDYKKEERLLKRKEKEKDMKQAKSGQSNERSDNNDAQVRDQANDHTTDSAGGCEKKSNPGNHDELKNYEQGKEREFTSYTSNMYHMNNNKETETNEEKKKKENTSSSSSPNISSLPRSGSSTLPSSICGDNNIPILFNEKMDEREMFKYLDLLRHLPSKKGGAQYKLHKAILTEEMVKRAKKFPLVQGVYFDRYQQRWSVNWNEDGKRVAKYFPIKLFGFDYARRLAIYCKNYQKIPEEALIFEQAYRANQQNNKVKNDSIHNSNTNNNKLKRGNKKNVKRRNSSKSGDRNEDDSYKELCSKKRKNISTYQNDESSCTNLNDENEYNDNYTKIPGNITSYSSNNYSMLNNSSCYIRENVANFFNEYDNSLNKSENITKRVKIDKSGEINDSIKLDSLVSNNPEIGMCIEQKEGITYFKNYQVCEREVVGEDMVNDIGEVKCPCDSDGLKGNIIRSGNFDEDSNTPCNEASALCLKQKFNTYNSYVTVSDGRSNNRNADRMDQSMHNVYSVDMELGLQCTSNDSGRAVNGYVVNGDTVNLNSTANDESHNDSVEKYSNVVCNVNGAKNSTSSVNSGSRGSLNSYEDSQNEKRVTADLMQEVNSDECYSELENGTKKKKKRKQSKESKHSSKRVNLICASTGTLSLKSSASYISSTSSCLKNTENLSSNEVNYDNKDNTTYDIKDLRKCKKSQVLNKCNDNIDISLSYEMKKKRKHLLEQYHEYVNDVNTVVNKEYSIHNDNNNNVIDKNVDNNESITIDPQNNSSVKNENDKDPCKKLEDIKNMNKYSDTVNSSYKTISVSNNKHMNNIIEKSGIKKLEMNINEGINKEIQDSNVDDINSRIVGVHYDRKQYRWKATWYTSHGRRCAKYYPIKQYGYLEAKKMAIECRKAYNMYKKLKRNTDSNDSSAPISTTSGINGISGISNIRGTSGSTNNSNLNNGCNKSSCNEINCDINFENSIFPREYYITLFENDEKKDGYYWENKKSKKNSKKSACLDNNEKQRRHYNEALKKINNIKLKEGNDGTEDVSNKRDMNKFITGSTHCNIENNANNQAPVEVFIPVTENVTCTSAANATKETSTLAASNSRYNNENTESTSTSYEYDHQTGTFTNSFCNNLLNNNDMEAHNDCSAKNTSSLLSLYYLSENILKFQKGTIKCILQDLRDNCLSNLAYELKNITFQEYYMAIHYLNRYVDDSNCYDDIFFLLKILAKNLEIRKIPSLYNEEEQKEFLNSLTIITKQMKNSYAYFTSTSNIMSSGEPDRFSSLIFQ